MRRSTLRLVLALSLLVSLLPGAAAQAAPEEGIHSENMTHVKNIRYEPKYGETVPYGTDIEFAKLGGREYAVAGSEFAGLHLVDITKPEKAAVAAIYDCGVLQGDVQVFNQGSRTFVTYTSEDTSRIAIESRCVTDNVAMGNITFTDANKDGKISGTAEKRPAFGTYIVEITDPTNPQTAGFIPVPEGSHNGSVHPSGNFFYNSNSSLLTSTKPGIEVYDISDVTAPKRLTKLALPYVPLSLGSESHDITFNTEGDRAYSAALSQGVIINTENPAEPKIITSFVDPSINVWHQSDPVTLTAADGTKRDFLLVEDEVAGALPTGQCPNGGVHVFEITGELEKRPLKVGYWNIDEVRTANGDFFGVPIGGCTAHVFDIHEAEGIMTIAFYNGGVRVVDLNGLTGIGLGETAVAGDAPMRQIGFYRFENSDTWSAKTPKIHPVTGDFYLYGNDINRGLDIYKFEGEGRTPPGKAKKQARNPGRWMTPAETRQMAAARPALSTEQRRPICLLPQ